MRIQDQLPGGPVSTPPTTWTERLPHALTDAAVIARSRVNEYASSTSLANASVPRRGTLSWLKECIIEGLAAYGEAMYPYVVEPNESVDRQDWAADRQRPHQDRDDIPHSYGMPFGFEDQARIWRSVAPGREHQFSEIDTFAPEDSAPRKKQRNWFLAWKATIASNLGRFWLRARREQNYRAMIKGLESLDDRTLKDIGIPRGQIEYAVRHDRRGE